MDAMPVTDALFLSLESREKPFHVASLQLFQLPEGGEPFDMQTFYRRSLEVERVREIHRKRVTYALGRPGWTDDEDLDLEYHVRHSALPRPGRVRELLTLISRLHGTLLDRNRPLWETHLIEGLSGNRFAVYSKMHHALVDGVSGVRLVQESLSEDADERNLPPPWADRPGKPRAEREPLPLWRQLARAVESAGRQAATVPGIARGIYDLFAEASRHEGAAAPYRAPRTILNVPITGSRRYAAQSWPIERVRRVGKACGATLNDTVLAMCAGALRAYLLERDALPQEPLIAMVPVSVRPKGDEAYGNAVAAVFCNLATHLEDPRRRLEAIRESMNFSKSLLARRTRDEILNMGVVAAFPMLLGMTLGLDRHTPPPFNVTISNVPGPRKPLYWNGARLAGLYPVSIVTDMQALNITLTSYCENLEFGLIGCRRSVPHLQRLLGHLDDSLIALERSVGIDPPETPTAAVE